MLSAEVIAKIRRLEIHSQRLVSGGLAGAYVSSFRGTGMEFDRVREYIPGDDVRRLDWNVTARMHAPYIKVFREERELNLFIVVDRSPSMNFGSQGTFKSEQATELAAMLAFLAIKNQDRVGLMIYGSKPGLLIPPAKGQAHVWNLIRSLYTYRPEQNLGKSPDDLKAVSDQLHALKLRSGLCFVVSDFFGPENTLSSLKRLCRRFEILALQLYDPLEWQLPAMGLVALQDPESGDEILLDTEHESVRQAFAKLATDFQKRLEADCRKLNVRHGLFPSHGSGVAALASLLKAGKRVKAG